MKAASKKKYTTERRTIKICLLKSKKKDLFRPTKTEIIWYQQNFTLAEENPDGRGEEEQEAIKHTKSGK